MNNQPFYLTSYHQIRRCANLVYSGSYIIGLYFMGVVYALFETYNSYILRGKLYTLFYNNVTKKSNSYL